MGRCLMTTRTRAVVGSFVFFWVAPVVVAGVGPFALVGWTLQPPLLGAGNGPRKGSKAYAYHGYRQPGQRRVS